MIVLLHSESMKRIIRHWQLYIVVLLPIGFVITFCYIPMYGLQIAFKDYDPVLGILKSPWIGMENFLRFIRTYNFWDIFRNTLAISAYSILAGFPLPIILALSLNECGNKAYKKLVQTVTYAPHFISLVVLVSMVIQFLSVRSGMINNIIALFGLERQNFLAESGLFRHIYVWSGIWQHTGYSSILYLASLASIDQSLYEAADIDGASKLQKVWYIDIPGIIPTAIILLILEIGSIMDVGAEKAYIMQNPLNLRTSEIISTYVFKMGIQRADFSFAAAIGLFNSVINATLLVFVNKLARKYGDTSLW